jgi:preprotein translocase SecE subunit
LNLFRARNDEENIKFSLSAKRKILADKNSKSSKKPTVRERAAGKDKKQPRRLKVSSGPIKKLFSPLRKLRIPLPDNKFGRGVRKFGRTIGRILLPKYFRESWREVRQVTWPTRKETINLTVAVFVFSVIFTTIVAILDFGLDKLFREIIIK